MITLVTSTIASSFIWLPPYTPAILILSMIMIAIIAGAVHFRFKSVLPNTSNSVLIAMRLLIIATILLCLLNPSQTITEQQPAQSTQTHVILDQSASMNDRTLTNIDEFNAALHANANAHQLHKIGNANSSEIYNELQNILSQLNPSYRHQLLLITDGHDTSSKITDQQVLSLSNQARLAKAQLFSVPMGENKAVNDINVSAWPSAELVYNHQDLTITALISSLKLASETITVELYRENQLIDSQQISLAKSTSQTIQFRTQFENTSKQNIQKLYKLRIAPRKEESNTQNNEAHLLINHAGQQLRVALIEGAPFWDTRFLLQHLKSNPQYRLDTYIKYSQQRIAITRSSHANADQPAPDRTPASLNDLKQYDMIILGKHIELVLSSKLIEALPTYAEHGGKVLFARGQAIPSSHKQAKTLSSMIPIKLEEKITRDTQLILDASQNQQSLKQTLAQTGFDTKKLPSFQFAYQGTKASPSAIILAMQEDSKAKPSPAIIGHRYGNGRTLMFLGQGLWQWAMQHQELPHHFYNNMINHSTQWLLTGDNWLPGQAIQLDIQHQQLRAGQTNRISIRSRFNKLNASKIKLQYIAPNQATRTLPLFQDELDKNQLQHLLLAENPDIHTVSLKYTDNGSTKQLTQRFIASPETSELSDTTPHHAWLETIASNTNATSFAVENNKLDIKAILKTMQDTALKTDNTIDRVVDTQPWWQHPALLISLFILLAIDWLYRRLKGAL